MTDTTMRRPDDETMLQLVRRLRINGQYGEYSLETVRNHTMTYEDYQNWVWTTKIQHYCPAPFHYYIKVGEFIANEMLGDVVGYSRRKNADGWCSFVEMGKYDWRYLDEVVCDMSVADGELEHWIINLEDLICEAEEEHDLDELVLKELEGEERPPLSKREETLLEYKLALWHETQADIARGK